MQNTTWHNIYIQKIDRIKNYKQKPCVIWLTGLSGSGKSTIANELEVKLFNLGLKTYLLDGDNIRCGLNKDLGFNDEDRVENIRRIGEVAKLFVDAGIIVLCAFISPFEKDRRYVRELFEKDEFIEVYLSASLKVCEQRDIKGLYKKARSGEIKNFTGIDSVYEIPKNPEIICDSANLSIDRCVNLLYDFLSQKNMFCKGTR